MGAVMDTHVLMAMDQDIHLITMGILTVLQITPHTDPTITQMCMLHTTEAIMETITEDITEDIQEVIMEVITDPDTTLHITGHLPTPQEELLTIHQGIEDPILLHQEDSLELIPLCATKLVKEGQSHGWY
ncbi:unnamed protein product [Moneuplotes crassus]|uniref:Uncharacterized protein n=1 Tax=Euplotes crassus TaxID=5936 RepID=A0AAD1XYM1_EUPCR|nr:unnamed protein product [Moneuplotes crassus]